MVEYIYIYDVLFFHESSCHALHGFYVRIHVYVHVQFTNSLDKYHISMQALRLFI